jgi:hypothetical protein
MISNSINPPWLKGSFGQKLMSLLRVGEVHDEHDPALVLL